MGLFLVKNHKFFNIVLNEVLILAHIFELFLHVFKKVSLFVFIGNGKTKQSTRRCAVEISEIVNRIAPQVIVNFCALYMQ